MYLDHLPDALAREARRTAPACTSSGYLSAARDVAVPLTALRPTIGVGTMNVLLPKVGRS